MAWAGMDLAGSNQAPFPSCIFAQNGSDPILQRVEETQISSISTICTLFYVCTISLTNYERQQYSVLLDANNEYWQGRLAKECKEKPCLRHTVGCLTSSICHLNWKLPGIFQQVVDVISNMVQWQPTSVYIHNIMIISKSQQTCNNKCNRAMTLLHKMFVAITLRKGEFFSNMTS